MIIRLKQFGYLLLISFVMGFFTCMMDNAFAQKSEENLEWGIKTSKKEFYPGEPVLLTLKIKNTGKLGEKIDFGADGIEAFSIEIRDNSNKIVSKGGKILRTGFARLGTLAVSPEQIAQKSIVLNQWCSTLLPPGQYHVACYVEYRLRSEATRIPDTEPPLFNAGPIHRAQLDFNIELIRSDVSKYKGILENLAKNEIRKEGRTFREWQQEREIARNMIAFTEWEAAVPYQLNVLRLEGYTRLSWDVINSLVKSKTLEATIGLIQIVEDPSFYNEGIKNQLIDAVYRLRETGKPDIIKATEEFIKKYERPFSVENGNIVD
jgi:hypothetical protein